VQPDAMKKGRHHVGLSQFSLAKIWVGTLSKGNTVSRSSRFALVAFAATSLVVAPGLVVAPAYATTIDVAGQQLNFGNAVDQIILESAGVDDSYLYENVVTVGGVQVDALVTVVGFSENSLGNYLYEDIPEARIVILNDVDPAHVDVAGCYSNEDYVTAYEAGDAYDFLGFNAPGSLKGGTEVRFVDDYEDEPEWEHAINTSLDLCDPAYSGEVDGYVDINVAFQVSGNPVTLTNVAISAHDIDGEQQVQFYDPAPTAFFTSDDSLVTIDDFSDSDDYIQFNGPFDPSEDGFDELYVGEVSYDSVSEFNYSFIINNRSRGSLALEFSSYFNPGGDLASTGVDAVPAGIAGLAVLGLGSAMVIARNVRRRRA
jgi:hypothetical protein